ncbi:hypothetical protein H257_09549 [Aphanomyces astaci]|uniref:Tc1-like transposase DDE domain-containing protein n=2 Tax=Aphanomyces astaci TaxID=112090 RepID=W4GA55_APHAT|nr:hypothetical protein H257_09549 [Aphanomyces astaci]ETV76547.1 hypothetical protein H257_09549 [Aphanomyces astaci]|eukprot:XP_009834092.1 hypothetical protein H257_09549 [Aphanomyces astaci]
MNPSIASCFAFVKEARHRTLTREERLDILCLHAYFRSQGTKAAAAKVAELLGRGLGVVKEVWREYLQSRSVTVAVPPSNTTTHSTTVPRTKQVVSMVQAFVRGRRATRTRTTAVDIVIFLREICVLDFDLEDKKVYSLHLRSVQRFLKYQGYERGNKKGLSSYHLSKKNTVARDLYVQRMHPHVGSASRPAIVYTDESFVHHHYKCHNQSLYHPSDVLDVAQKEKHKVRRRVMALDIFTGGTTLAKEPKDYHGMFDHAYYVGWFQRLLDELDEIRVSNALIVMDNAKYHKGRPSNTPQSRHRKEVLIAACTMYGIPVTGTEFKSLLWEKLAAYIETNVLPVVMTMASERGHTVVYTPPSPLRPATD